MHAPGHDLLMLGMGALVGAPDAEAVGGTIFDNNGNVYVTYDSTHWSDGFPGLEFNLPTQPDGTRLGLVRYSGWWFHPSFAAFERPGDPQVENYDPANGRADFNWPCTAYCLIESGRVLDAGGPSGTSWSSVTLTNPTPVTLTLEVFHLLDPLTHGQASGAEQVTVVKPGLIEFDAIMDPFIVRSMRYRANLPPVSECGADATGGVLAKLNHPRPTTLAQSSYLSASGGVHCAMQWHVVLQPGEIRTFIVSVSHGIPKRLVKGDVDLDNMPDIYFDEVTGDLRWWRMKRTTRVGAPGGEPNNQGLPADRVVGIDDFDGDYLSDLLLRNEEDQRYVEFRRGHGFGFDATALYLLGAPLRTPDWQVAATGDFNRDGYGDMLWRNTVTQKLEIWFVTGGTYAGAAVPSADQAVDGNWWVVAASDWDNDGDLDLLWYWRVVGPR